MDSSSQPGPSSQSTVPVSETPAPTTRREDDIARKDRTLAEFMLMLDEYEPLIPNEVTDYYLQRVGFESEDVRLKRLLSLAAQKFVSDIAADAFQHARLRTNTTSAGRPKAAEKGGAGAGTSGPSTSSTAKDKSRTVLTMDDLSSALAEYGVNARKPEFFL